MTKEMDELMHEELAQYTRRSDKSAGFLPCVKQLANVASLPGIVKWSIGLPVVTPPNPPPLWFGSRPNTQGIWTWLAGGTG